MISLTCTYILFFLLEGAEELEDDSSVDSLLEEPEADFPAVLELVEPEELEDDFPVDFLLAELEELVDELLLV